MERRLRLLCFNSLLRMRRAWQAVNEPKIAPNTLSAIIIKMRYGKSISVSIGIV